MLILPQHQIATAFALTTSLLNAGLTIVPLMLVFAAVKNSPHISGSMLAAATTVAASDYNYSTPTTLLLSIIAGFAILAGIWLLYLEREYCVVDFVGTRGVKDVVIEGNNDEIIKYRRRQLDAGGTVSSRSSSARLSRYFYYLNLPQHDEFETLSTHPQTAAVPPPPHHQSAQHDDDLTWLVSTDRSSSRPDLFQHWRDSGQF